MAHLSAGANQTPFALSGANQHRSITHHINLHKSCQTIVYFQMLCCLNTNLLTIVFSSLQVIYE